MNDAASFADNNNPFTDVFPDWFRDSPNEINHLDTDIVLAFPSLDTSAHPHFNGYTDIFATNNTEFLSKFFTAMHKMGQLGVSVELSPATECEPRCGRAGGDVGGGSGDNDGDGESGKPCCVLLLDQTCQTAILLTMHVSSWGLPQEED